MKSLIVAFALVLSSGSAMAAQDTFSSYINDNLEFDFISWCEGNKVIAQNQEGKNYVRANCEEQGMVCKTYNAVKVNMSRVIYSAGCEAK